MQIIRPAGKQPIAGRVEAGLDRGGSGGLAALIPLTGCVEQGVMAELEGGQQLGLQPNSAQELQVDGQISSRSREVVAGDGLC